MAKLVRDERGRLLFTKEMKREYTLLMPQMLPIHFGMFCRILERDGYKVEMLTTHNRGIIDTGLKYVHNDSCYPALLVIGQLIQAVDSGLYDPHKVALLITQTGGGCRASNYIHLLRKALERAGYDYIPVVSVSFGMERNPGFNLTWPIFRKMLYAIIYGDLLMNLAGQVRPYETELGSTEALTREWTQRLVNEFGRGKAMSRREACRHFAEICRDYCAIPVSGSPKPRVGVVGEIYVKFSPLGNNNLEQFLLDEGTEPVVPGLIDFMVFKMFNRVTDVNLYGGSRLKRWFLSWFISRVEAHQRDMIDAIKSTNRFRAPNTFSQLHSRVHGYLGDGNKMGEGWLLTAEMLELIHDDVCNIVCTQPFGCLPNHIAGKGMVRKIKEAHPEANIVAIDYDPGATKINQENRIKLMLANARMDGATSFRKVGR